MPIFYSDTIHDFQRVVFHTQNTIFVFHNIQKFIILFKRLIVTTAEVYQYHFLINKNKEKTLQWSYNVIASNLQCDSFKLPKQVILTFLGEINTHLNKP